MKNFIDDEKINKTIEKTKMYKRLEDINFDNIKAEFNNLSLSYSTSNKDKLVDLQNELGRKLNTISKIHSNNLTVLSKNIEKYKDTSLKVEKIFDDII